MRNLTGLCVGKRRRYGNKASREADFLPHYFHCYLVR